MFLCRDHKQETDTNKCQRACTLDDLHIFFPQTCYCICNFTGVLWHTVWNKGQTMGWRPNRTRILIYVCKLYKVSVICIYKPSLTVPILNFISLLFWCINMYNTDNPIRVDSQSQQTPPNFLHLHKIHPVCMLTFALSFLFHFNINSQCPHLLEFRVEKMF